MINDDSFYIGLEPPTGEFRALMDRIGSKFKTSYSKRSREYGVLVRTALANSPEDQFPLLRRWMRDTEDVFTSEQQDTRLYDDALAQLDYALERERNDLARRANDE